MHSENKVELMRQIFPDMDDGDLEKLAQVAELRTYPPQKVLCHEGQIENTFYALVSGQVEVLKQLDGDTQVVINRPGPSSFVGEIALIQEIPRTATVRTAETTTVLEIDRADFVGLLNSSASMAVRIMLTITPRLRDIDLTTIAHLRQRIAELTQANTELQVQCEKLQGQQ